MNSNLNPSQIKSLPYYLQILKVVENNLDSFNFTATFAKPQTKLWKQYLGMVERIVPDSGRFMVIADYLHQPRGQGRWQRWRIMNRLKRFCLSKAREVFSCNWRIFVSGAVNFRLAGRKSRNKQKLAKKAIEILKKLEQKNEVEADCVYATSTIGSISEFMKNVKRAKEKAGIDPIYAAYGEDNLWLNRLEISILRDSDLSRGNVFKTSWRKVSLLKPGMMIATADGSASADSFGVVKWERITKIEKLPAEQVFDIEVEATHNFVGNGIVAHNTTGILMRAGASSLQLSSSATSTTADIQLAAADRIDLFASSLSLQTSSQTAGELKLMSKGSLILDTSGAAGGGAPIVMLGGNVGIGTTGPSQALHIAGTNADYEFYGGSSVTANLYLTTYRNENGQTSLKGQYARGTKTTPLIVQNNDLLFELVGAGYPGTGSTFWNAGGFRVFSDGTPGANDMPGRISIVTTPDGSTTLQERLTVKNDGNVGIGTTSPLQLLHVKRATDGPPVRFEDSNGYCEIDPTTTTWTCTSDLRLKKDITPLDPETVLEGLSKLQGVNFRWLGQAESSNLRLGFVAQDVERVFPELVRTDENGLKSVAYGGFTPYLVEAIKELNLRVGNLTNIEGSSQISQTREMDTTLIRDIETRITTLEDQLALLATERMTIDTSYLNADANLGGNTNGLISPLPTQPLTLDTSLTVTGKNQFGGYGHRRQSDRRPSDHQ